MADRVAPYTVGGMVAQSVNPRAAAIAEAYKRGILPPQQAAAYEHAIQRGLIKPDAQTRALMDARQNSKQRFDDGGMMGHYAQGATYGFLPEIGGAMDAAGNWLDKTFGKYIAPLAAPGSMASQTFHAKAPTYSPAQAAAASAQATRENLASTGAAHPWASTAATLAGGLKAPGTMAGARYVARGGTWLAKTARSGAVGVAQGAVAGAGNTNGDLGARARGALTGGVIGGATGIAVPTIATAGQGAWNTGRDVLRAGSRLFTGDPLDVTAAATPSEQKQAFATIVNLAKSSGATPADLDAAAATGKPVTVAEAIGRPAVTHAAATARRAGTTPDNMDALMTVRAEQAPSRVMSDFSDITGVDPATVKGNIDASVKAARAGAGDLFDTALSTPGPIWNDRLAALSELPAVKRAIQPAIDNLLNDQKDPYGMGLVIDPDTGSPVLGGDLKSTTMFQPTAEAWDEIRRQVGSQVERDQFGRPLPDTAAPGNYGIRRASQALTEELRNSIPGLAPALDASGDYLSQSHAFQRGADLFADTTVPAEDFSAHLNSLGPADQKAFVGGVGNSIYNKAQAGQLTAKKLAVPIYADKLRTVMGDAAPDWASRLQSEIDMAKTGARMAPGMGSPTYELGNAGAEQDGDVLANGLKLAVQAKASPLEALGSLIQNGMAYGSTNGTSVGARNAMGDILTAGPGSDHWQALQDALNQIGPQPSGRNLIVPTTSSDLSVLLGGSQ